MRSRRNEAGLIADHADGVILLAYVVAIPANEIVIPAVLMMTVLTTKATGVGRGAVQFFQTRA